MKTDRHLPPPPKKATTARDSGAPSVASFWTASKYKSLVRAHWDSMANSLLNEAGSDKSIEELPPEVVAKVRSKSIGEAIETGLKILYDTGKLLTDRQYNDLAAGRVLQPGDLARYIGPSAKEEAVSAETGDVQEIFRKHGQLGHIEQDRSERRTPEGRKLLVFVPKIDETSGTPQKLVDARLVFAPWRGKYWQFARVFPSEIK